MAITTRILPSIEEEAEQTRRKLQSERELQPTKDAAMTAKVAPTLATSKSHSQVCTLFFLYFKFQFLSNFISQVIKGLNYQQNFSLQNSKAYVYFYKKLLQ